MKLPLQIAILAAGKGKRMHSALPKVLHPLGGKPLLAHVLATARAMTPRMICIVEGAGDAVRKRFPDPDLNWARQDPPRGTGDALRCALAALPPDGVTLVMFGADPLAREATLREVVEHAERGALSLLTIDLDDPSGYGRIVRSADGSVAAIVEHKDATLEQQAIREINTGVMAAPTTAFAHWLAAIDNRGQGAAGGGPFVLAPVVDGRDLPRDPWDPTAPEISADVPVIIGSVNTEGTFFMPPDSPQFAPLYSLDDAGLKAQLTQRYGDAAEKLIEAYRKEAPEANPSKLFFMAAAFPGDAIKQAERKFAQAKAPAYMYLFTWETPVEEGRRHSPHTIELPFVFDNPQEQPDEVGNGPDLQPLADRVSGVWTAFARTGSPNTSLTPKWPAYNTDQRATMIINDEWKVANDPRHEVRLLMQSLKGAAAS